MKKSLNKVLNKNDRDNFKFTVFAIVLSSLFLLYPIFYSIYLSLHSMQGLNANFVGIGNYVRMFQDPVFRQALWNNFVFLIFQVPIMLTLALILAFLLNTPNLKGRSFFRIALFCQVSHPWSHIQYYFG